MTGVSAYLAANPMVAIGAGQLALLAMIFLRLGRAEAHAKVASKEATAAHERIDEHLT